MSSDLYQILDVRADADREAIRSAFRRQVKALHPDTSGRPASDPRAAERLALVVRAYRILTDAGLRRRYDAMRLMLAPRMPESPSESVSGPWAYANAHWNPWPSPSPVQAPAPRNDNGLGAALAPYVDSCSLSTAAGQHVYNIGGSAPIRMPAGPFDPIGTVRRATWTNDPLLMVTRITIEIATPRGDECRAALIVPDSLAAAHLGSTLPSFMRALGGSQPILIDIVELCRHKINFALAAQAVSP